MKLQNKEQAKAFLIFLESEALRHKEDIKEIKKKEKKVANKFNIPIPKLRDWREAWVDKL